VPPSGWQHQSRREPPWLRARLFRQADVGAIAVLHALVDRGEAQILGFMVSSKNEWTVPCLEAINTWYGRPDLPIGYQHSLQYGYHNLKDPGRETPSKYAEAVVKNFPHRLQRSSDAPVSSRGSCRHPGATASGPLATKRQVAQRP